MAKVDWTQSGSGSAAVINNGGSMRLQITNDKLLLWTARNNLANSQVVADIYMGADTNTRGGLVLRSDGTINNCYRLLIYGPRTYYIQKVVAGVATTLLVITSTLAWNVYAKTRFTVDGYQLSVEEYINGNWVFVGMVDDLSQARASGYAGLTGANVSSYYEMLDNVEIRERT